uniref:Putative ovule protein n=1 Tax=Solanum chacoense TaxID=4108 RepID=A0A0V0I1X6_SOLCH
MLYIVFCHDLFASVSFDMFFLEVSIGNSFSTSLPWGKVCIHSTLPDPMCGITLHMMLLFLGSLWCGWRGMYHVY